MISASMPAATVVKAADQQILGNIGGYDYEMWNQDGQGQASMEPSAGSFTCSWSNIENFLARMGKEFDSQQKNYKDLGNITLSYDVEYTPRGFLVQPYTHIYEFPLGVYSTSYVSTILPKAL